MVITVVALLMIAGLTAIYFLRYSDRPLLFVAEEGDAMHADE